MTLRPCPHLKGKHVVLGRVVKGAVLTTSFQLAGGSSCETDRSLFRTGFETIVAISKMPVDAKDRPLELITIQHCGELERKAGEQATKFEAGKPPCSGRENDLGWADSSRAVCPRSGQTAPPASLVFFVLLLRVRLRVFALSFALSVARPQSLETVPVVASPIPAQRR